jgi:hypothetical protein
VSRAPSALLILLAACADRPAGDVRALPPSRDSADSAFTLVQARGQVAMGVDQYTSAHRFEPLADGGMISLQRDALDSAGVAQIRSHMQTIAASFKSGNFTLPGFVHGRKVPGTGVMAAHRSTISYTVDTLSGGARLRLTTRDPAALAAIHEFLAFQRHDHRAGGDAAH